MQRPAIALVALIALAACSDRTGVRPSPSGAPTRTTPSPTAELDPFALARRYEVARPEQIADRLEEVEGMIRRGKPVTDEAARVQQAAYRQLVRNESWREPTYQLLPGWLRPIARANVGAGLELRLLTAPRQHLPPWRIVAPPSSGELRSHYTATQAEFGTDWYYLAAIHLVETRMGRIRGDSVAGAKGPMQFLPATWAAYGEGDIESPRDAIRAAGRYLAAHGAPDDMRQALFAYNHSDHYVRAIELYADRMRDNAAAYDAYHGWEVYYRTTRGDAMLYVGWPDPPTDVTG